MYNAFTPLVHLHLRGVQRWFCKVVSPRVCIRDTTLFEDKSLNSEASLTGQVVSVPFKVDDPFFINIYLWILRGDHCRQKGQGQNNTG